MLQIDQPRADDSAPPDRLHTRKPVEGVGESRREAGTPSRSNGEEASTDRLLEAGRLLRTGLSDEAVERLAGVTLDEIVMLRAAHAVAPPSHRLGLAD